MAGAAWRGRRVRHRRRWSRFFVVVVWWFFFFFAAFFNSFISLVKFSLPLLARKPPSDGQRARFEAMIPSLTLTESAETGFFCHCYFYLASQ